MRIAIDRQPLNDGRILSFIYVPRTMWGSEQMITVTSPVGSIAEAERDELLRIKESSRVQFVFGPDFLDSIGNPSGNKEERSVWFGFPGS